MDYKNIEKKWQKYWEDNNTFAASNSSDKPKYYVLAEFPYPSGTGLHMGHLRGYTATDLIARKKRLEGYNVLYPMGWDAFGLPAENYAIKNHIHPSQAVAANLSIFKGQLKQLGYSFDWTREFSTTDENYYKWTQWMFLKFYEHGMAHKGEKQINWCVSCKVGLANEEVEAGVCERCGGEVIKVNKEQWILRMSDYAQVLIDGLDETNFLDKIKTAQTNWIGRSEGAIVDFEIDGYSDKLSVFTTRPDTLFGVTFMVLAPEHPLLDKLDYQNKEAVLAYQKEAARKTDIERGDVTKTKTGVKLEGVKAINPVNKELVDIYIADYVMMGYGTGAIMAVPAHDERDYAFAQKYNIEIKEVISPVIVASGKNAPREKVETVSRPVVDAIIVNEKGQYLLLIEDDQVHFVGGGTDGEPDEVAVHREVIEECGYEHIKSIRPVSSTMTVLAYRIPKNVNQATIGRFYEVVLADEHQIKCEVDDGKHQIKWVNKEDVAELLTWEHHSLAWEQYLNQSSCYTGEGEMINSGFLNGLSNKKETITKMIEYLELNKIGTSKVSYRLQDWVFSRQRFWGEPIPMIHCPKCGWVPVPESELPVKLPDVTEYEPTDDGESPLAKIPEFVNTTCPRCGLAAKRETDTMPNWAGSSWYYLRYMDAKNDETFANYDVMKYWGQVDWYNGGMEHATRHLLYARFWHRFLYNQHLVPLPEPFNTRVAHGMVLAEDGTKISKSKNNGVNPSELVDQYGADAIRCHMMFIGDYEKEVAWNIDGIKGCQKFLNKVYRLHENVVDGSDYSKETESLMHQTIKKVTEDIDAMKYGTAVSALMILTSQLEKLNQITKQDYQTLLILLNPIAPHVTEELASIMAYQELATSSWPSYDEDKIISDVYSLVIQVNGKVRATVEMDVNATEEEVIKAALMLDKIQTHIKDKEILKTIVVPKKLINIVVK